MEAGSAALRVDWPVYPRRAEHNTVAEGGNRRCRDCASAPPAKIGRKERPERHARRWAVTRDTQCTAEMRNTTGSDVLIAASTMAG